MPEYPEIAHLAEQMDSALRGKRVAEVEVLQPKCLNVEPDALRKALDGATLGGTRQRGKWLLTEVTPGWLLLNLGMGGEVLLTARERLPEKRRVVIDFSDGSCLSINFWWFGYLHFAARGQLEQHEMTAKLGPNVLDLSRDEFTRLLDGQKGSVKSFLLDQSRVAGIGNAYIHDILFLARVHPLQKLSALDAAARERLFDGVQRGLRPSVDKGGAFYEMDLFGQKGGFTMDDILIGYKEGRPCPECGHPIEKIKTGGTSSFICPSCQAM